MASPVSIKTIAARLGLTHGTVSRALQGDPRVKPETARRILELAKQLDYTPSRIARGLRTRRTGTLGIIISRLGDPFYSEVLRGVHDAVVPAGYSLFVGSTDIESDGQRSVAHGLWEQRVDGLLIGCLPRLAEPFRQLTQDETLPLVFINRPREDYAYVVYNDDGEGVKDCIHYLCSLGHRRIAFLGNLAAGGPEEGRCLSFREVMSSRGLTLEESHVFFARAGDLQSGRDATALWLESLGGNRPTALFCYNDLLAIGALRACRMTGLQVPADLSLVGFDDIELAGYVEPTLTTFAQPKYELGNRSATMMLQLLQKEGRPAGPVELHGHLVPRESTRQL